jgi:hypothetical protein
MVCEPGMTITRLKKRYSHDLLELATAVVPYYPGIEEHLDLIRDINESYKGKDYEYPAAASSGFAVPEDLDGFADFTAKCRHDLYLAHLTMCGPE